MRSAAVVSDTEAPLSVRQNLRQWGSRGAHSFQIFGCAELKERG